MGRVWLLLNARPPIDTGCKESLCWGKLIKEDYLELEIMRHEDYVYIKVLTEKLIQPVAFLGDLHIGHKNSKIDLINKVKKYLIQSNAIILLTGDLIECSIKSSIGAGWAEQTMPPGEQIDMVVKLLEPLKQNIIGLIDGNHEYRAFKMTGINPSQIIAQRLGVPYCGNEFFGDITRRNKNDGCSYTLYACHSETGNKTEGLEQAWITREWSFINADIKAKSHAHGVSFQPVVTYTMVPQNSGISKRVCYQVGTGSYIERLNSYASRKPMAPKLMGTVALELTMSKDKRGVRPVYLTEDLL